VIEAEIKKDIAQALKNADRILVISHANPDGDAMGSTLGLTRIFNDMGKRASAVNKSPVPKHLKFLPGADAMIGYPADAAQFDAIVVLDSGERSRIGNEMDEPAAAHPLVINIDHHTKNTMFGVVNCIDTTASSVGEMILELCLENEWVVTPDAATCLYCAVYTDTTAFSNDATSPKAMRAAAHLVEKGADFKSVPQHVYNTQWPERLLLMGMCMQTLRMDLGGRIAGVLITQKMMAESGAGPDAIEGFVEMPRSIAGVDAAYVLREVDGGKRIKGSLRTTEAVDAVKLAKTMDGGGHPRAAGFHTIGPLEAAREMLVQVLAKELMGE